MFRKFFLELNDSFLENYNDSPIILDTSLLSHDSISKFLNYSLTLSGTFLIISLILCIISLIFSFETFQSAKIKKAITDTAFAIFMLGTLKFFINFAIEGSNLFYLLWSNVKDDQNIITSLLDSAGVTSAVLPTLNFSFLILISFTMLMVFLFYILNSVLMLLAAIGIILFPIAISLFPIALFKKIFQNFNLLMLSILMVLPLQGLCITLADKLFFNNTFSINSLASLFGLLVIITLVMPGLAIASFNRILAVNK